MRDGIWIKIPEKRVELIHNQTLEYKDDNGEWHRHVASKKTPIVGTVHARMYKKVGANMVEFYKFVPDFLQKEGSDRYYSLSANWFRRVKQGTDGVYNGE